jgi:hypothetical protein
LGIRDKRDIKQFRYKGGLVAKKVRKINHFEINEKTIYALCDDGSLWETHVPNPELTKRNLPSWKRIDCSGVEIVIKKGERYREYTKFIQQFIHKCWDAGVLITLIKKYRRLRVVGLDGHRDEVFSFGYGCHHICAHCPVSRHIHDLEQHYERIYNTKNRDAAYNFYKPMVRYLREPT